MSEVVIVTGASSGIGKEIAYQFARNGYIVVATYNNTYDGIMELKDSLEKEKIQIDIIKADVSKRSEVKKISEFAMNKYGKIDILINNAGISEYKIFNEETDDDWNMVINTNLYSAFAMSQEVSKYMIQKQTGLIINMTSIWGMTGASMEVIYSISKAGMTGLTKALAKELGPSNIRVNSIAPGVIDTRMNNDFNKEEKMKLCEQIPLGKVGNTEDIAKCALWLAKDSYTTGQEISINGGLYI